MGVDNDDRLLRYGTGLNDKHEKKVKERLANKQFLHSFNGDNTGSKKFHYTSPEGLKGIMETRTFFFTDSQFLNDFRKKSTSTMNWIIFGKVTQRNTTKSLEISCAVSVWISMKIRVFPT